MNDAARLFLALWPEPAIRGDFIAWRDRWQWPRTATPVHDDKLHLTLHFIGNVERTRLSSLRGELRDTLRVPMAPVELDFGVPELWHHSLAVLVPLAAPPALLALQAALGERLAAAGLVLEDRPYRPHVTMARRANGVALPVGGPPIHWRATGYALMESIEGRYVVLEHYGASEAPG